MHPIRPILGAAAIFGVALAAPTPAAATLFCNIEKTPDGFVALRAKPDPKAKLVGRMTPDDEVQAHDETAGKWIRVTWWRGGRWASGKTDGVGYDPPTASGWMHSRYLSDTCG